LAYQVCERLRGLIAAEPFAIGEGREPISVTASIGVGSIQGPDDNPTDLLSRADAALYESKRNGRNKVTKAAA
jgi:two-component system cell cycle response regulator